MAAPSSVAGQPRFFPEISNSLYRNHPELSMRRQAPRIRDAFRRPDRSGEAVFTRIMAAHQKWFTDEMAGRFDSADCYREEMLHILRSNGDESECWQAGAQRLSFGQGGPAFRRCFQRELVIDSFAGLFLAQVNAGLNPMQHPLMQMEAISQIQKDSGGMDAAEERRVVDPLVAAGAKEGGTAFLLHCVRMFPKQQAYANLALGQMNTAVIGDLKSADNPAKRLAAVKNSILLIESLRVAAPWFADCYILIGLLERERAVALANRDDLRGAFGAIARTESYAGSAAAEPIKGELNKARGTLEQRAAEIMQYMSTHPGKQLTVAGGQLVSRARKVMRDAERWERSPQAKETVVLRDAAKPASPTTLLRAHEGFTPYLAGIATVKVASEPLFADWLGSHAGRWMRRQWVATAVVIALTLPVLLYQAWASHSMQSARRRADQAIAAERYGEALDALGDYISGPRPLKADHGLDAEVASLYRSTFAQWAASRASAGSSLSDEDRRRIEHFTQLASKARGL